MQQCQIVTAGSPRALDLSNCPPSTHSAHHMASPHTLHPQTQKSTKYRLNFSSSRSTARYHKSKLAQQKARRHTSFLARVSAAQQHHTVQAPVHLPHPSSPLILRQGFTPSPLAIVLRSRHASPPSHRTHQVLVIIVQRGCRRR
jgi:carotenoid cleavage dioxygenase-like enzyme